MPGEHVEIAIQRLNIHPLVHHCLRTVNQYLQARRFCLGRNFLHRVHRAQHVGHLG
ncbi:hypothetical protein D3C80_2089460 [compost metagenome]